MMQPTSEKIILDACCGGKMFWLDKNHPNVVYGDVRRGSFTLCDGREFVVEPDVLMDFTKLPFPDCTFKLGFFDPPHMKKAGKNAWMATKYGVLGNDWEKVIKAGFDEYMRVLDVFGVLIFKWNEVHIKTSKIIEVIGQKPLVLQVSGRAAKTHWMTFVKFNK